MTLQEAIPARHSVRAYQERSLDEATASTLREEIERCNREGQLHIQLILDEPRAFQGRLAKYGKFSGVTHYLVVAARKSPGYKERAGYYGERLVLLAQTLGLNTCWVGLSYSKVPGTYTLQEDEKILCYIAIGHGLTQGAAHKVKTVEEVSNASGDAPEWFRRGVEAALLAPTAINQQKFFFEWLGEGRVRAHRRFSLVGYTEIDLGIAKQHFELAAGSENFHWA